MVQIANEWSYVTKGKINAQMAYAISAHVKNSKTSGLYVNLAQKGRTSGHTSLSLTAFSR